MRGLATDPDPREPLGVLLLPVRLEEFEFAEQARDLLSIPRVVALEPRRRIGTRWADQLAARQARRLRFPGDPRVLVLYHPAQYPLARALGARYAAELWYLPTGESRGQDDALSEMDALARERAVRTVSLNAVEPSREQNQELREHLVELEIISARPFVPGARITSR